MKRLILSGALIVFSFFSFSQTNLKALRQTSWQIFIYKISADTAEKYIRNYASGLDHYLSTTPFAVASKDSFNYDELPIGNYLFFSVVDKELQVNYHCQTNLMVMPVNNQYRVQLEVRDINGNYFDNATVWVNGEKTNYNVKAKAWQVKSRFPDEALIKVGVGGDTLLALLSAKEDVRETVSRQRWVKFTSTKIGSTITWPFYAVKKMLESPASDWFKKRRRYRPQPGYILFNKPLYKPGDTLKLKGYVVNRHLRQYKKPLSLVLNYYSNGKYLNKKLATVKPVTPGSFIYDFVLGDSLKSDLSYTLEFRNKKDKRLLWKKFQIEDYLLDEVSTYEIRSKKEKYYSTDTLTFFTNAKDANGLSLMDGKIRLQLLTDKISKWYKDTLYVPDTIWTVEKPLAVNVDTKFEIPASVIPPASIDIRAIATFSNSNNEVKERSIDIKYEPESNVIDITQTTDSIYAVYMKNGKPVKAKGALMKSYSDKLFPVNYPYAEKLDAYTEDYDFNVFDENGTSICNNYYELNTDYRLSFSRLQQQDTSGFVLYNPKKVLVHFTIFYGNKIIEKSSGNNAVIIWKSKLVKGRAYRVEWQYIWAGEERKGNENIVLMDKVASLQINGATTVFPGLKDTITIKAIDYKNRPLAGMNLTAVSYNSQFAKDINVPEPPFLHRFKSPRRIVRDNFEMEIAEFKESFLLGKHKQWINKFGLDTMQYYKLLFPVNGMEIIKNYISDFTPQLSVFVVNNGVPQEIHLLYINKRLTYYNGTTDKSAYSFSVYPGYAQIAFRLRDKYVQIDSVYLQPNYKHDVFIDVGNLPAHSFTADRPLYWTTSERNELENNLWQLANDYKTNYGYVWQGDKVFYLGSEKKHLVGPFNAYGELQFFKPGSFDIKFDFEPGYEYSIKPVMVRLEKKSIFPPRLKEIELPNIINTVWKMGDTLVPPPVIQYKEEITPFFYGNYGFDYYRKKAEYGSLQIDLPKDSLWRYIILLPENLPWKKKVRMDRSANFSLLDPGKYELVLITSKNYVLHLKNILVKADYTTCIKISTGNYSLYSEVLDNYLKMPNPGEKINVKEDKTERKLMETTGIRIIPGNAAVSGWIKDNKGESPIPFAAVRLKGYSIGTITNANGYFELSNIASGFYTLQFSAIGYAPTEVKINLSPNEQKVLNINLSVSESNLQEVVVTGYGISRQNRALTSSISTVNSAGLTGALNGKIAGVQVSEDVGTNAEIRIRGVSSLNFNSRPLYIVNGVPFDELPSDLDTTGMTISILKDALAVSLYGARAANGVIIINSKDFIAATSLRDKFRDYAFWQPNLITNEKGEAKFAVTYPDNITSWRTFILGMDKKRRIAKTSVNIKSFKPLLAQLSVPQFLIEGDSVNFIGKKANYTTDDNLIKESFSINSRTIFEKESSIEANSADTSELMVCAVNVDTLSAKYSIYSNSGFSDGELRKIPMIKQGIEETVGNFWVLNGDTVVHFKAQSNSSYVTLHAQNNTLDVLLSEIDLLKNYPYYCMEQTASKLKGLVMEKKIRAFLHQKFTGEKEIAKLREKIQKAQLYEGGWPWWENGKANLSITNYITRTLLTLRGDVELESNIRNALLYLQNQLSDLKRDDLLNILLTLSQANHFMNFETYLAAIPFDSLSVHQQWQYISIKQQQKIDYASQLKELLKQRHETILGGLYWGEESWWWYHNATATTVEAYKVLENDGHYSEELNHIIQYFMEKRKNGRWANTVEAASIVSTILPRFTSSSITVPASVRITGDTNCVIKDFPFTIKISSAKSLQVDKMGGGIVYFTAYQKLFNPNPEPVINNFIIHSWFEKNGKQMTLLKAGEKIQMQVEVNALKDAEYVQIEIPIPAGCTYAEKKQDYWGNHKEYLKNKTVIFVEKMYAGVHRFTIELEPRYTGKFHLNPSKAELMYFPTFYGRSELKKVEIER
ncbi:MAG TPA: carboxypeptidase-like regulatory domain-containing protein [Chitinophagaceae bacterium]|nr:carboxypeptidase-like regulatory domain-containing protein [Chitinophagaceae bacterium]